MSVECRVWFAFYLRDLVGHHLHAAPALVVVGEGFVGLHEGVQLGAEGQGNWHTLGDRVTANVVLDVFLFVVFLVFVFGICFGVFAVANGRQ